MPNETPAEKAARETAELKASADEAARKRAEAMEDDDDGEKRGDDPEWKSDPKAKKHRFLVTSKIKGRVQGKKLKLGDVVELEVTADLQHMIRPGCLEPVGAIADDKK